MALAFPCGSAGKESSCSAGDLGSIPGLGRSPGERKGYPLQYSGLGNSMDHSPWVHKESDMIEWPSLTFIMVLCLVFLRRAILFSTVVAPIYIPTNSVWGSLFSTCSCCSVTKVCPTLCDPKGCSTEGFPVTHYLLEFSQVHVHWIGDAILSCPLLLLPSIFPNIRMFSNESAIHVGWPKYWSFSFTSVLPKSIQGWFPLRLSGLISLLSKGLSRVFSNTTVQNHQLFSTLPTIVQLSHL